MVLCFLVVLNSSRASQTINIKSCMQISNHNRYSFLFRGLQLKNFDEDEIQIISNPVLLFSVLGRVPMRPKNV